MDPQRVPRLFLPAGALDSKQSSVEPESVSGESPITPDPVPIHFEHRSPKDSYPLSSDDIDSQSHDLASLWAEIQQLRDSCARYESQNQELRNEIHLSTTDLLLLDKDKRDLVAENRQLQAQISHFHLQISAIHRLFRRLEIEESDDIEAQCDSIYSEIEDLSGRLSRLKVMYNHVSEENHRLNERVVKLESCEKQAEDLQTALQNKEKRISVLEDQLAVLRSTASRASSGRNSSEAYKRGEYRQKTLRKPKDSGSDLIEDGTEMGDLRVSSGSTHDDSRLKCEDIGRPPLSISPVPRVPLRTKPGVKSGVTRRTIGHS